MSSFINYWAYECLTIHNTLLQVTVNGRHCLGNTQVVGLRVSCTGDGCKQMIFGKRPGGKGEQIVFILQQGFGVCKAVIFCATDRQQGMVLLGVGLQAAKLSSASPSSSHIGKNMSCSCKHCMQTPQSHLIISNQGRPKLSLLFESIAWKSNQNLRFYVRLVISRHGSTKQHERSSENFARNRSLSHSLRPCNIYSIHHSQQLGTGGLNNCLLEHKRLNTRCTAICDMKKFTQLSWFTKLSLNIS